MYSRAVEFGEVLAIHNDAFHAGDPVWRPREDRDLGLIEDGRQRSVHITDSENPAFRDTEA